MKDQREAFFAAVDAGTLSLEETVREMRKSVGMSQADYAKMVGVAPRVLAEFERGAGNPTVATLRKIIGPFGLEIAIRRSKQGSVRD